MNLQNKLGEYFYKKLNIDDTTNFTYEIYDPNKLFVVRRLDLIAKYMLVKFKCENIKSDLALKVYEEHISIFSDGRFFEPGSKTKKSFNSFLQEFYQLYESIKMEGFDNEKSLIPVGNDNSILDGAHRVACAAILNKNVYVVKLLDKKGAKYDYSYFVSRHISNNSLFFLVLNYCLKKEKNIYAICLWPISNDFNKKEKAEEIIKLNSDIIYKCKHKLSYDHLKNFMIQIYGKQKWIGSIKNHFSGVYEKVDRCFADSETTFYFIEGGSLDEILIMKEKIRSLFNIGKHSVHITDSFDETLQILNIVCNPDSMKFLHYGDIEKAEHIKNKLKEFDVINFDQKIMKPEYTLELFGLIKNDNYKNPLMYQEELDLDIQYDLRNFFYVNDIKYFTPNAAKKVTNSNAKLYDVIINIKDVKTKDKIKNKIQKHLYKMKREVRVLLNKLHLLEFVSSLYKQIR